VVEGPSRRKGDAAVARSRASRGPVGEVAGRVPAGPVDDGDKPNDVQRLGDAFLADPGRVMDRVQFPAHQGAAGGHLKSNEQQRVSTQTEANKQVIIIERRSRRRCTWRSTSRPSCTARGCIRLSAVLLAAPAVLLPGCGVRRRRDLGRRRGRHQQQPVGWLRLGPHEVNINVNRYNNVNVNNRITNNNNKFVHNPDRRGDVRIATARAASSTARSNWREPRTGSSTVARKAGRTHGRGPRSRAGGMKQRGVDPAGSRDRAPAGDRGEPAVAGATSIARVVRRRVTTNRGGTDNRGAGPSNACPGCVIPRVARQLDRGRRVATR